MPEAELLEDGDGAMVLGIDVRQQALASMTLDHRADGGLPVALSPEPTQHADADLVLLGEIDRSDRIRADADQPPFFVRLRVHELRVLRHRRHCTMTDRLGG